MHEKDANERKRTWAVSRALVFMSVYELTMCASDDHVKLLLPLRPLIVLMTLALLGSVFALPVAPQTNNLVPSTVLERTFVDQLLTALLPPARSMLRIRKWPLLALSFPKKKFDQSYLQRIRNAAEETAAVKELIA